jgi:hypothetical protein
LAVSQLSATPQISQAIRDRPQNVTALGVPL